MTDWAYSPAKDLSFLIRSRNSSGPDSMRWFANRQSFCAVGDQSRKAGGYSTPAFNTARSSNATNNSGGTTTAIAKAESAATAMLRFNVRPNVSGNRPSRRKRSGAGRGPR